MSVYQPLGAEDIALIQDIAPQKNQVRKFCENYSQMPMAFHACSKESWPLFRQEIFTAAGMSKFCGYTADEYWQNSCYLSLMNPITDEILIQDNNIKEFVNFCGSLPDNRRWLCVYGGAQRLMQVDPKTAPKAFAVCSAVASLGQDMQNKCYQSLVQFARLGFLPGSAELQAYCEMFPQAWKEDCTKNP